MTPTVKISNELLYVINQLFEIEQKTSKLKESNTIQRNLDKLKTHFLSGFLPNEVGLSYHNPIGEPYTETRTDCEASISGNSTKNLIIVEVIKPIIRTHYGELSQIVQKAIVVVEEQKKNAFFNFKS